MTTLYHNPRCSKSREALKLLEERNESFEIRKYLDDPLSEKELRELIKKLEIKPMDLVRRNEAEWKEYYKGKELSDSEIISAMVKYPRLIERPILEKNNKAVVGRPPQNIIDIL